MGDLRRRLPDRTDPVGAKRAHRSPARTKHLRTASVGKPLSLMGSGLRVLGNVGLSPSIMEGALVWSKEMDRRDGSGWGSAASPVVHKDRSTSSRQHDQSFLLPSIRAPGREVWACEPGRGKQLVNAVRVESSQRTVNRHFRNRGVRSYDLDGKLPWTLRVCRAFTFHALLAARSPLHQFGLHRRSLRPTYAIRPARRATSR